MARQNAGLKPCSTQTIGAGSGKAGNTKAARIEVGGYLFARDFPEVVRGIRAQGGNPGVPGRALGMSYEITDARVDDLRAGV